MVAFFNYPRSHSGIGVLTTMRIIELNGEKWTEISDFYAALLAAVGAPSWNGHSIAAALDSIIWDGLNEVKPPYTIQIKNLAKPSKEIFDECELLKQALTEARAESITRRGSDVDVNLEIVSLQ
jgi:RNAse (barnase) inhibitor barstar